MSKVEVKALKGEEAYDRMAEIIFDTYQRLVNIKLSEVTTMAAFNAGLQHQDTSRKPGLFKMHDGVSVGDGMIVFRRLMEDELAPLVNKYVNGTQVYPYKVIKEFAELVDKIEYEFI